MNRRDLFKLSGVTAAGVALGSTPLAGSEKTTPKLFTEKKGKRVVICGGGFGGLTVAKYLREFNNKLDVIVIDKKSHFISCPYSNTWLGEGENIGMEELTFDYSHPASKYGYRVLNGTTVIDIDRKKQTVRTNLGAIDYDYLVLAPGIDYDYSRITKSKEKAQEIQQNCPPALMPFGDHLALKKELKNFKGGNFIISIPSGVYRCPPAPYERACMVAYYFKKHNIKGKVVVLDPRSKPATKAEGFLHTFKTLYKDIIQYVPDVSIKDVDTKNKVLYCESFSKETYTIEKRKFYYQTANIIPENRANSLIDLAK
ncbi:MAG: NAD(P)/FAD-dependent oxidoreductase, partial [Campylobacterales bacterium]|nr:NAD(P)/FAD-dependent oxidoreductase [Campylobacterales bacterium]